MRPDLDLTSTILHQRLIGVVRSTAPIDLVEACRSLYLGGVRCVEIALNTPGALAAIARVRSDLPAGCVIGAGTVTDVATAQQALSAGAQFVVTPIVDVPTIEFLKSRATPAVVGAFTPTEMFTAFKSGASLIKWFPATRLTPADLREILAALPELRICPMGGVTIESARDWFANGAAAVGVGSGLLPRDAAENGRWNDITQLAQLWSAMCTLPTSLPGETPLAATPAT